MRTELPENKQTGWTWGQLGKAGLALGATMATMVAAKVWGFMPSSLWSADSADTNAIASESSLMASTQLPISMPSFSEELMLPQQSSFQMQNFNPDECNIVTENNELLPEPVDSPVAVSGSVADFGLKQSKLIKANNGNRLVFWTVNKNVGSGAYVSVYDQQHNLLQSKISLQELTQGSDSNDEIDAVLLNNGRITAVWSQNKRVYMRQVDSTGNALTSVIELSSGLSSDHYRPSIIKLSNDNVCVVWPGGSHYNVGFYNNAANLQGSLIRIQPDFSPITFLPLYSTVQQLSNGNVFVMMMNGNYGTLSEHQNNDASTVFAQEIQQDGTLVGNLVPISLARQQQLSSVKLSNNRILLMSSTHAGCVTFQFDGNGNALSSEFSLLTRTAQASKRRSAYGVCHDIIPRDNGFTLVYSATSNYPVVQRIEMCQFNNALQHMGQCTPVLANQGGYQNYPSVIDAGNYQVEMSWSNKAVLTLPWVNTFKSNVEQAEVMFGRFNASKFLSQSTLPQWKRRGVQVANTVPISLSIESLFMQDAITPLSQQIFCISANDMHCRYKNLTNTSCFTMNDLVNRQVECIGNQNVPTANITYSNGNTSLGPCALEVTYNTVVPIFSTQPPRLADTAQYWRQSGSHIVATTNGQYGVCWSDHSRLGYLQAICNTYSSDNGNFTANPTVLASDISQYEQNVWELVRVGNTNVAILSTDGGLYYRKFTDTLTSVGSSTLLTNKNAVNPRAMQFGNDVTVMWRSSESQYGGSGEGIRIKKITVGATDTLSSDVLLHNTQINIIATDILALDAQTGMVFWSEVPAETSPVPWFVKNVKGLKFNLNTLAAEGSPIAFVNNSSASVFGFEAALVNNEIVVARVDTDINGDTRLYLQWFDTNGNATTPSYFLSSDQFSPQIRVLNDDYFVVFSQKAASPQQLSEIHAQVYSIATKQAISTVQTVFTAFDGDLSGLDISLDSQNKRIVFSANGNGLDLDAGSVVVGQMAYDQIPQLPVLVANDFAFSEDESTTITDSMLDATDVDSDDATLQFIVSNVQHGHFELVSNPNVAITQFSQQAVINRQVRFVPNGGETTPSFNVSVSDGQVSTMPVAAVVQYTHVNDAPVLANNQFVLKEAEATIITTTMLSANDVDTANSSIVFTVTQVQHGHFELVSNLGSAITQFSQQDVINGQVRFVPDGGETTPSFKVSVSDGQVSTMPVAAVVQYTHVNDAPVLANNQFVLKEAEATIITTTMLSANDVDTANSSIVFTVTQVQHGHFELVGNPDVAITQFSQQDVINGQVRFVPNGGETTPSFKVSVSDGQVSIAPVVAVVQYIRFNDASQLTANQFVLKEDKPTVITTAMLAATDVDNDDATLQFIVSDVQHGHFELVSNPGSAITQFSQQAVINGQVRFVPDGGETTPSFNISVSDGQISTMPVAAVVQYMRFNDASQLTANQFVLREDKPTEITTAMLAATDVDNDDATLQFIVSNVQHGRFELVSNPNATITQFSQQDVINGQVRFVPDGGETTPSFKVSVSDGQISTMPVAAVVQYMRFNDTSQLTANQFVLREDKPTEITTAMLAATDVDNDDATLQFIVSNVQHGHFELVSNPGSTIMQFSQQDVINGQVHFVPDGGETTPSFNVSVSDGQVSTASVAAIVQYNHVNDVPNLTTNQFVLREDKPTEITTAMLAATDVDNDDATLQLIVSNVQHGRFELVSNPNVAITQFSQQAVINRQVRFVPNGGETTPSFNVSVSDGQVSTMPTPAIIQFILVDNTPVLTRNALTVHEANPQQPYVSITRANLLATDVDTNDASLIFHISSIQHGYFINTNQSNQAVTEFSLQDVDSGYIRFYHDGGEAAPSYSVSVSDGNSASTAQPVSVSFIPYNDAPIINHPLPAVVQVPTNEVFDYPIPNNTFTDPDGESLTLSVRQANAEALPNNNNVSIQFNSISSLLHGLIRQEQSIALTVQAIDSANQSVAINFTLAAVLRAHSSDTLQRSLLEIALPSILGFFTTILGFWARKRHINKQWKRSPHFFHDELRKELKISLGTPTESYYYIQEMDKLLAKFDEQKLSQTPIKDLPKHEQVAYAQALTNVLENQYPRQAYKHYSRLFHDCVPNPLNMCSPSYTLEYRFFTESKTIDDIANQIPQHLSNGGAIQMGNMV